MNSIIELSLAFSGLFRRYILLFYSHLSFQNRIAYSLQDEIKHPKILAKYRMSLKPKVGRQPKRFICINKPRVSCEKQFGEIYRNINKILRGIPPSTNFNQCYHFSLYSLGGIPSIFLNTLEKYVGAPNPHSKPISSIFFCVKRNICFAFVIRICCR